MAKQQSASEDNQTYDTIKCLKIECQKMTDRLIDFLL